MLKRLRADNFKSLINVVFEPGAVNLLIGRNNSGKTTLCQAMKFLGFSVYGSLADAAIVATGEPMNLTNAYLQKDTVTFDCACEIQDAGRSLIYNYTLVFKSVPARHLGPLAKEYYVDNESLTIAGEQFPAGTLLMHNDGGKVKLLHEGRYANNSSDPYVENTAPTNATMLSRLYDLQHNRFANLFKDYLGSWAYYDLETVRLRSGDAKTQSFWLNSDGSNLTNVLYLLKTTEERRYRRFIELVREVEPKIDGINFAPPTQDTVFMALTDARDKRFGMPSISTGTLRYMAIAYILLISPIITEATGKPAPLIIIEEPENGLYVGHLKRLMSLLEPLEGYAPQFIFTSHSPYFIDQFEKYLENIFIAKSDGTHSEITKPDLKRLEEILKDIPLGEAHFRGLLE